MKKVITKEWCLKNSKHDVGLSKEGSSQLDDLDPMPFGKYKDDPMQDVPANYLHWLWTNGKEKDKNCPVADYICRNIDALKQEYSNGIW